MELVRDAAFERQVFQQVLESPRFQDRSRLARLSTYLWAGSPISFNPKDSRTRILQRLQQRLHQEVPANRIPGVLGTLLRRVVLSSQTPGAQFLRTLLPGDLRGGEERIRALLPALPPLEAAILDLYFIQRHLQTDIAAQMGIRQPSVCYRIQKAAKRLQFLLQTPKVSKEQLVACIAAVLPDPVDIQVMVTMWQTGCQSETARRLGKTQGFVRHRFFRALQRLRQVPGCTQYVDWFDKISRNLNITREVVPKHRRGC